MEKKGANAKIELENRKSKKTNDAVKKYCQARRWCPRGWYMLLNTMLLCLAHDG